ncbi:hypothetical protein GCM10010221_62470 [Streptomyces parvus]|nr:hypothetical protein GCM10010221_62470 [Streptomyces parvus]
MPGAQALQSDEERGGERSGDAEDCQPGGDDPDAFCLADRRGAAYGRGMSPTPESPAGAGPAARLAAGGVLVRQLKKTTDRTLSRSEAPPV